MQREWRLERSSGRPIKGLVCWAEGLELFALDSRQPLEDCREEHGRIYILEQSRESWFRNGLEKGRPGEAVSKAV